MIHGCLFQCYGGLVHVVMCTFGQTTTGEVHVFPQVWFLFKVRNATFLLLQTLAPNDISVSQKSREDHYF